MFCRGESATNEAQGRGCRRCIVAGDVDETDKTKVRDVGAEVAVEEDVGRLDVAVDELSWAAFVEMGQPASCAFGDFQPYCPWKAGLTRPA